MKLRFVLLFVAFRAMSAETLWFQGSVEQAFQKAQENQKPVLLYWGAQWCPPCNELKSEVFSKPRFKELTKRFIPVHIDGDSEKAQFYSDQFHVFGYPTVLLLSPQKKERLRLSTSVNMDEMESSLARALASGGAFEDYLKEALSPNADPSVFSLLAHADWGPWLKAQNPEEQKRVLAQVVDFSSDNPSAQVMLAGHYLEVLLQKNETLQENSSNNSSAIIKCLELILDNEQSVFTARNTVIYSSGKVAGYFENMGNEAQKSVWLTKWQKALTQIIESTKSSPDTKLWAWWAKVSLQKGKSEHWTKPQVQSLQNAAMVAEKEAKGEYQRKATVSGAAWILQQVGMFDEAHEMLVKELRVSSTPWYYLSSLASLEEKRDNPKVALFWSRKARISARGPAARLQWLASDLVRVLRLTPEDLGTIRALLYKYYQMTAQLPDGFSGRNGRTALRLARSIRKHASKAVISWALKRKKLCDSFSESSKEKCLEHFAELSTKRTQKSGA